MSLRINMASLYQADGKNLLPPDRPHDEATGRSPLLVRPPRLCYPDRTHAQERYV